jgi:hypothetical protein
LGVFGRTRAENELPRIKCSSPREDCGGFREIRGKMPLFNYGSPALTIELQALRKTVSVEKWVLSFLRRGTEPRGRCEAGRKERHSAFRAKTFFVFRLPWRPAPCRQRNLLPHPTGRNHSDASESRSCTVVHGTAFAMGAGAGLGVGESTRALGRGSFGDSRQAERGAARVGAEPCSPQRRGLRGNVFPLSSTIGGTPDA